VRRPKASATLAHFIPEEVPPVTEDPFLRSIRERPDDEETRLVYADWLEDRGDDASLARARFIRLEQEAATTSSGRLVEISRELQRLAGGIEPAWLAVVSRPRIEKCEVGFEFECPQNWDRLAPTAAASVRFCSECRRNVYYCATREEALDHAVCGNCVAVDARVLRRGGDLDYMALGRPKPPPRPDWDAGPEIPVAEPASAAPPPWLKAGGRVRVADGAFAGAEAVVKRRIDDLGKVEVELAFLGQVVEVSLDWYQVDEAPPR
jgi:uncharacterized protein (TIGR02996 family)